MIDCRREQVIRAVIDQLRDPWFRSRTRNDLRAIEPDQMPALVVLDGGDEVDEIDPATNRVRLRLDIAVVCRADDPATLGRMLSEARARVLTDLFADRTLGGAAMWLQHAGTADPVLSEDDGQPPEAAMVLSIAVEYLESTEDLWR